MYIIYVYSLFCAQQSILKYNSDTELIMSVLVLWYYQTSFAKYLCVSCCLLYFLLLAPPKYLNQNKQIDNTPHWLMVQTSGAVTADCWIWVYNFLLFLFGAWSCGLLLFYAPLLLADSASVHIHASWLAPVNCSWQKILLFEARSVLMYFRGGAALWHLFLPFCSLTNGKTSVSCLL